MQPTTLGRNKTGASLAPESIAAMNDASDSLAPDDEIDTSDMEAQKLQYVTEADAVGSVPPRRTLKGVVKTGVAALSGGQPTIFFDKLGERIAFERTGARLYDALIVKLRAAEAVEQDLLPRPDDGNGSALESDQETAMETLLRIRAEELEHFGLLCEAMVSLGGDPTAQTPCADVAAVATSGILQVVNDPRTTLAQCLNAMLTAELTDNAGWELLISLAEEAGESELAGRFLGALAQEQDHLAIIKQWLIAIVAESPRPAVV